MPALSDRLAVDLGASEQQLGLPARAIPATVEDRLPLVGPTSVAIVSNSKLLCEGLGALLVSHADIVVVGELAAANEPDAAQPVPQANVVLLDASIGRPTALRWTRFWREQRPPAQVIVLELANDADIIIECIEAGACGYTLRGAAVSDVVASIQRAQRGHALCSPEVTARLFARLAATAHAEPAHSAAPLTCRELEVLHYVATGCSNRLIAEALVIEVRTVKHHVHNILSKLKLNHRDDAARYALDQGWIAVSN